MNHFFVTLLLIVLLTSCNHDRDVKKLRQAFEQTCYDKEVIKSLPLYDSLKNIITSNIDTIFKFRNSRHFVDYLYANGNSKTVQEDAISYDFYYNYGESTRLSYGTGPNDRKLIDDVSVENMPAFIYPSVDTIFKKLGKNKIRGFTLWTDNTIEISVKGFSIDNIDETHTLIWKRSFARNDDPDFFIRDTTIASKWTYRILVEEYQGR